VRNAGGSFCSPSLGSRSFKTPYGLPSLGWMRAWSLGTTAVQPKVGASVSGCSVCNHHVCVTITIVRMMAGTIDLLLNWGCITYLPFMFVVWGFRTKRNGTRLSFWFACTACITGVIVRLIPTWFVLCAWMVLSPRPLHHQRVSFTHRSTEQFRRSTGALYFLHAGQILNGIAGPSVCGLVRCVNKDEWSCCGPKRNLMLFG